MAINGVGGGAGYTQMIQQMQNAFQATAGNSTAQSSSPAMPAPEATRASDTYTGASGMQVQAAMSALMNATGLSGTMTTQDAMNALQNVLEGMAGNNGNGNATLLPAAATNNTSTAAAGPYAGMDVQSAQLTMQNLVSAMTSNDTSTANKQFATQFQDLVQQLGAGSPNQGNTLTKLATLISQNLPNINRTA